MSAEADSRGCCTAEAFHDEVPVQVRAQWELGAPRKAHPSPTLPSPTGPKLASCPSPTNPVLRANPFPEVTDLICRLPLPTLSYRLEATHLRHLLRIWVRFGTKFRELPLDFQGPTTTLRAPQEPWRFARTSSLSPAEPFPGRPSLKKKRKLFPGLLLAFPGSFALPRYNP